MQSSACAHASGHAGSSSVSLLSSQKTKKCLNKGISLCKDVFLFLFFFFSFPCREHLGSCLRFERHLAASLPAAPKGEPGEWGGNKRAAGGSRGEAAGEKGSWEEERQRAALIACPRIPAARESPPPPCSSRHLHVASRAQPKNRSPPRCACSATKAAIYPFLNSSCVVYESLGEGKR